VRIRKIKTCIGCGIKFYNWSNEKCCSRRCFGLSRQGIPLSVRHRKKLSIIKSSDPKFYTRQLHTREVKKKVAQALRKRIADNGGKQPWIWGEKHWAWKGGLAKQSAGYLSRLLEHGNPKRKLDHRLVMEEYLGRSLRWDEKPVRRGGIKEVVHHVDGDKSNNDIGNLEVMLLQEHTRMHMTR
jgi:hypothetical protein